jgi:hypothetical protein
MVWTLCFSHNNLTSRTDEPLEVSKSYIGSCQRRQLQGANEVFSGDRRSSPSPNFYFPSGVLVFTGGIPAAMPCLSRSLWAELSAYIPLRVRMPAVRYLCGPGVHARNHK